MAARHGQRHRERQRAVLFNRVGVGDRQLRRLVVVLDPPRGDVIGQAGVDRRRKHHHEQLVGLVDVVLEEGDGQRDAALAGRDRHLAGVAFVVQTGDRAGVHEFVGHRHGAAARPRQGELERQFAAFGTPTVLHGEQRRLVDVEDRALGRIVAERGAHRVGKRHQEGLVVLVGVVGQQRHGNRSDVPVTGCERQHGHRRAVVGGGGRGAVRGLIAHRHRLTADARHGHGELDIAALDAGPAGDREHGGCVVVDDRPGGFSHVDGGVLNIS